MPDPRADVARKALMGAAGALARCSDDFGRVRTENAVEDFVGRDRERDEQADRRALVADGGGRKVELGDDLVDGLLGQLGQIPLSQIMRRASRCVHTPKR